MPASSRPRTIGDLGEFALIDWITRRAPADGLVLGVGDDAAVFETPPGWQSLVSADLLVEDVHFRRSGSPAALGHKALAVNLSDIAAMGGVPTVAILSLALPRDLPLSWIDGFADGFHQLARQHEVALGGGDVTSSPGPVAINVTIMGRVETGRMLTRAGACPTDDLYICGPLGLSRAGFESLEREGSATKTLAAAHLRPMPLIGEGRALLENEHCSACIDVSDGLLGDLAHICERSHCGARIDTARLPIASALALYCKKTGGDPLDYVLNGGEDYALLFTLEAGHGLEKWAGTLAPFRRIGTIVDEPGIVLCDAKGNEIPAGPGGFKHF